MPSATISVDRSRRRRSRSRLARAIRSPPNRRLGPEPRGGTVVNTRCCGDGESGTGAEVKSGGGVGGSSGEAAAGSGAVTGSSRGVPRTRRDARRGAWRTAGTRVRSSSPGFTSRSSERFVPGPRGGAVDQGEPSNQPTGRGGEGGCARYGGPFWRRGRVVRQRPAKPCTPVRFRSSPPDE